MTWSVEPVLAASLFAEGRLDATIGQIVAPWWTEIRPSLSQPAGVWFCRYGRRGEHLKLRLHAADAGPDTLLDSLTTRAREVFDRWPAFEGERQPRLGGPSVDHEDEIDTLHADREVVATRARRNHVLFAGGPWLDDARHGALAVAAMTRAAEIVFSAIASRDDDEAWPHSVRQNTLFQAVAAALAGLGMTSQERATYHAFHRDWLLRTIGRAFEPGGDERLAKLRENMEGLAGGKMARAVEALATKVLPLCDGGPSTDIDAEWRAALLDMVSHGRELAGTDPAFADADPYAATPTDLPVFKVLHNLANQLGLAMRDEALAHQLLHSANARES